MKGCVLSERTTAAKHILDQNKLLDESEINPFAKISQNFRKSSFRMKIHDETTDTTKRRLNARHTADNLDTSDRRSSLSTYDQKDVCLAIMLKFPCLITNKNVH